MTSTDLLQIAIYIGLLIICMPLLEGYMARVFAGERTLFSPVLRPAERIIYLVSGVDADTEHNWKTYTLALLAFNILGFGVVFALQLLQNVLPLNPAQLGNVEPFLAFNTATSFMTNTN